MRNDNYTTNIHFQCITFTTLVDVQGTTLDVSLEYRLQTKSCTTISFYSLIITCVPPTGRPFTYLHVTVVCLLYILAYKYMGPTDGSERIIRKVSLGWCTDSPSSFEG